MMKSRKLGIGLLLMLAVVVTTGTFAYWATGVSVTQAAVNTPTVTIGSADTTIATTVTIDASGYTDGFLVPDGHEGGSDVNTITFDITVNWDGDSSTDADGATGQLGVAVGQFTFPSVGYTEANAMFNVTESYPNGTEIVVGGTLVIRITVYFENEPTDQDEYNNVASQNLSIPLTFTVTAD